MAKTFKQFLYAKRNRGFVLNGHGLHSLSPKEKIEFQKFKQNKNLKEEQNFFDENHNEHLGGDEEEQIKQLHDLHPVNNEKHINAIEQYTSDSGDLNEQLLRSHENKVQPENEIYGHNIKDLDDSFQPSQTTLHTYSGLNFDPRKVKPVGVSENGNPIYHSPAYISSSVDKGVAADFAGYRTHQGHTKRPQILHHIVNPGDPISVIGDHSMGPEEKEILHPRDSHFEHLGTTTETDAEGVKYDIHHVRRIQFDPKKHAIKPKPTPKVADSKTQNPYYS